MNQYILPDLPYDYDALEPHIAGEIMRLHHDKHHRQDQIFGGGLEFVKLG